MGRSILTRVLVMSLLVGLLPLIGLGWYFEGAAQRQIVNELKTHLARQA